MFTIIFDVGNVIVDYNHEETLKNLSEHSELSIEEIKEILALQGSDLIVKFRKGQIFESDFYSELKTQIKLKNEFSLEDFKKAWCSSFKLKEDVKNWIESDLLGNCNLIILSDTNITHYEYIKNHFEIINKFEKVYVSYETGLSKDTTEIFETIIKENNIDLKQCIFIDDTLRNIEVAQIIGIPSLHFKDDSYKKEFADLLLSLKSVPPMNKYAGVILIDEENNIYLSHRASSALVNPGRVSLFGGRVEFGEIPIEGAVRELKEELNLDISLDQLNALDILYKIEDKTTLPHLERLTECNIFYTKIKSTDIKVLLDEESQDFIKIKFLSDLKNYEPTKIAEQSLKLFFSTISLE